jgi:hypothetical protein
MSRMMLSRSFDRIDRKITGFWQKDGQIINKPLPARVGVNRNKRAQVCRLLFEPQWQSIPVDFNAHVWAIRLS